MRADPASPGSMLPPQQNGQEQLAPDKSQVENVETAACADQKRTAIIPPTVAKRHSAMLHPQQKGLPGYNAGHSYGCRPDADVGLPQLYQPPRQG